MNRFACSLMAGSLTLAACAPAEGEPDTVKPPKGECEAEPGQSFIGQKATGETGAKLLRATGATALRWVPPRTAVTMDFRPDRLTVYYDDDMVIERVSCT